VSAVRCAFGKPDRRQISDVNNSAKSRTAVAAVAAVTSQGRYAPSHTSHGSQAGIATPERGMGRDAPHGSCGSAKTATNVDGRKIQHSHRGGLAAEVNRVMIEAVFE